MKIESIKSFVLQYDLAEELGYSQQYYKKRSAHLVCVRTDNGIEGWGECFGPGNIALANKFIIENVISPMIIGENPLKREFIWNKIYNLLRDHGQKGMPIQALSGIDIALWDIFGKIAKLPLYELIGGMVNKNIPVYGYGMMLQNKDIASLKNLFKEESKKIVDMNFTATKMKIGLGIDKDLELVNSVRDSVGKDFKLMVDANHAYTTPDALKLGKGLEGLNIYWFEEPVAPEDLNGYKELKSKLNINIAGGEAEFTRWGWNNLIKNNCIDIAQPEVCALGGISEYLKVLNLAHTNFIPVINHVWGSAISVAVNLHLLTAMPDIPGGLYQSKSMLEFDTTHNSFLTELTNEGFSIFEQVKSKNGYASAPEGYGIGLTPNIEVLEKFKV